MNRHETFRHHNRLVFPGFPVLLVLFIAWGVAAWGQTNLGPASSPPPLPVPRLSEPFQRSELDRLVEFFRHRPRDAGLCLRIGRFLEAAGSATEGKAWISEACRLDPALASTIASSSSPAQTSEATASVSPPVPPKALSTADLNRLLRSQEATVDELTTQAKACEAAGLNLEAGRLYLRASERSKNDPALLELAAERFVWAQSPRQALTAYRRLLSKRPRDVTLYLKIAEMAEWAKDLPGAISWLQQAVRIQPRQETRRKLAQRLLWTNRPEKARPLYDSLLRERPRDNELRAEYADLLETMGEASGSLRILEGLPDRKMTPEQFLRRARLHLASGNPRAALADTQRIRKKALLKDAEAIQTEAHLALEQWPQADQLLRRTTATDAATAIALEIRRLEIARKMNDPEREARSLQTLRHLQPREPIWAADHAQLARKRGDTVLALEELLAAHALAPENEDYRRSAGELLLSARRWEQAKHLLLPLLERKPEDTGLRDLLRPAFEATSDWGRLLPLLWEDYLNDPSRDRLFGLIAPLVGNDLAPKAYELVLEHLRRDPFDAELASQAVRLSALTGIELELRQEQTAEQEAAVAALYERLIASLTHRLDRDPGDHEARLERARIELWRNRPTQALPDLLAVRQARPDDRNLLRQTIGTAEWSGNLLAAIALRHELALLEPHDATNTLRLAQQLGWNQRARRARPFYGRLLASDPERIGLNPSELLVNAETVMAANGRRRHARLLHAQAREHLSRETPSPEQAIGPDSPAVEDSRPTASLPAMSNQEAADEAWANSPAIDEADRADPLAHAEATDEEPAYDPPLPEKERQKLMTALQGEWNRQDIELNRDLGPVVRGRIAYMHDTEELSHTQHTAMARFAVGDHRWHSLDLVSHRFSQDKYGHRSFDGLSGRLGWHRRPHADLEYAVNLRWLQDADGRRSRLFTPGFEGVRKLHGIDEFRWDYSDRPVFDTPEAIKQDLGLKALDLSWHHLLRSRWSLILSGTQGWYSNGDTLRRAGATLEHLVKRLPMRAVRYSWGWHDTDGRGGNVYYAPRRIQAHHIAIVGEDRWRRNRLRWEAFVGEEITRSRFQGANLEADGPFFRRCRQWFWTIAGNVLHSTVSHFGGGKYGQWSMTGGIEWRGW